jgi:putative salt-induced outer membrane protein YdiY
MNLRTILLSACIALIAAVASFGDVVILSNGDRLTGDTGIVDDGTLRVATELLGEVAIPWSSVAGIETAGPVALRTADGTVHEGRLVFSDGVQYLESAGGLEPLVLADVQALGPTAAALETPPAVPEEQVETPGPWSGVVDLGASWRTGMRDTLDARSTLTLTRAMPKNKLTLLVDAAYGEDESVRNKQSIKGEAKWQFFPRERFYYYGLTGAEHDEIRKLELRLTGAAGLGYEFIKNDRRTWSGDVGLNYAHERWEIYSDREKDARREEVRAGALAQLDSLRQALVAGTFQPTVQTLAASGHALRLLWDTGIDNGIRTDNRVSVRLSMHYDQLLFERGRITEDLTVLPDIDNLGELRITNNLAFTSPLSDALSLRLALKSEYDSDPGPSVSNWDHLLTTGIQFKF